MGAKKYRAIVALFTAVFVCIGFGAVAAPGASAADSDVLPGIIPVPGGMFNSYNAEWSGTATYEFKIVNESRFATGGECGWAESAGYTQFRTTATTPSTDPVHGEVWDSADVDMTFHQSVTDTNHPSWCDEPVCVRWEDIDVTAQGLDGVLDVYVHSPTAGGVMAYGPNLVPGTRSSDDTCNPGEQSGPYLLGGVDYAFPGAVQELSLPLVWDAEDGFTISGTAEWPDHFLLGQPGASAYSKSTTTRTLTANLRCDLDCVRAATVPDDNTPEDDTDGDGVVDSLDNCPSASNPWQEDADGNGIGDACDVQAEFVTNTYVNSRQVDFLADDEGDGASYLWDFGDGGTATTREVVRQYAKAGEYTVTLVVTRGTTQDIVTHTVAADPARTYAPTVVLHPDESRYPYDPSLFVSNAVLKWSHDAGCKDATISTAPSARKLGRGEYKHQRTSDARCAHTGTKYSSKQLTAPRETRSVLPDGEKLEGFYLDLDNDVYGGTKTMSKTPMYVEFASDKYIAYWIFYAFNDWKGKKGVVPLTERHEGDWERIVVRLDETNSAQQIAYYHHYCEPKIFTWGEMQTGFGSGTGLDAGTHPIVFSAKGGHASYWKPGTFKDNDGQTACGAGGEAEMVVDTAVASTKRWKPWSGAGLLNARTSGWYGFGGLWGKPGVAQALYTSGIPGPSTYKWNDPKVPVVPTAWQ